MPAILSTPLKTKEKVDTDTKPTSQVHPPLYRIHMRGDFLIVDGHGNDVTPKSQKVRAIVVYLAMSENGRAKRSELASMFWPNHDEDKARVSLRQALVKLRRTLNAGKYPLISASRSHVYLQKKYLKVEYEHGPGFSELPSFTQSNVGEKDGFENRALSGIFLHETSCQHWLENARHQIKSGNQQAPLEKPLVTSPVELTQEVVKQPHSSSILSRIRHCITRVIKS